MDVKKMEQLCDLISVSADTFHRDLKMAVTQFSNGLETNRQESVALAARSRELDEREAKLVNRENAISQTRDMLAKARAENKTLRDEAERMQKQLTSLRNKEGEHNAQLERLRRELRTLYGPIEPKEAPTTDERRENIVALDQEARLTK